MPLQRRGINKGPAQQRDRRWHRTRGAILGAGQSLFAKGAIEGVSIDDIVAAADIAKGSFYNHFDGKQELANAIVELVQGDCEFHIFAANQGIDDPAVRMVRALCVLLRYAGDHPDRLQALINLSKRHNNRSYPLNAGVTSDLTAGLEQGRFTGVDLEAGLLIVLELISITAMHVMISGSSTPATQLAITMGAALLRALGVKDSDAMMLAGEASIIVLSQSSIKTEDGL